MKSSQKQPGTDDERRAATWPIHLSAIILVGAVVLAYANVVSAPFIFDDMRGVVENVSIRKLWPVTDVLFAPGNATGAVGRPLVNLSLALNYATGGMDVRGYHLFNMLLHAGAALTLFGILRRTFLLPALRERFGRPALLLAAGVALLWALHPLQTESVSCVIQRTEILGSLFYLLTLYAFVLSIESAKPTAWRIASVGACALGMMSKEIVATAPVIVFLFDRAFVAGTMATAWRERWRYYAGLGATWLLLIAVMMVNKNRGGIVGFGLGMSAWSYALTQCEALVMYLKLSFWPHPLVLDYGAEVVSGPGEVWWQGVLLLALVVATLWALVRRPMAGWVAFAAFSVLAPSSSFVPLTTQTMAEHRMYLPLAGVLILPSVWLWRRWPNWLIAGVFGAAVLGGVFTVSRNQDYRTEVTIWADTVRKWPDNPRSRVSYAGALATADQFTEAIAQYAAALRMRPNYADAAFNLGNTYYKMSDFAAAAKSYARTVEIQPDYAEAHYALGYCLFRLGRAEEGLSHYGKAEALQPENPVTLRSYASALVFAGRFEEARGRYDRLMTLRPNDAGARVEYGAMLAHLGDVDAAREQLETALQLEPGNATARYALGLLLVRMNRREAALQQFAMLLRQQPRMAEAHNAMGKVLLEMERWSEAVAQFQEALRLKSDYAEAQKNIDRAELLRDLRTR